MPTPPHLRPAVAADAAALSALAVRSKGHWGYDAAFLERCRSELQVTAADIAAARVTVAERDGTPVGFSWLQDPADDDPACAELVALFVEPDAIGSGAGRALLRDALEAAGGRPVLVESDPNAVGFYAAQGARRVGSRISPSTGRELPLLRF